MGAVITNSDGEILSTGYNGSPSKTPHCDEINHLMINGHCVNTIHAEVNAVISAAKNNISVRNGIIYSTHKPCGNCLKVLINAGIKKVFFIHDYVDEIQNHFERFIDIEKIEIDGGEKQ